MRVQDSRGKVIDGSCFVEIRTGDVSLQGFGHDPGLPADQMIPFSCASINGRYQECQTPIDGPVRLVKQVSDARRENGRSWGQRGDRVCVDNGCRARFEVTGGSGGWGPEFDQAEQACRETAKHNHIAVREVGTPRREGRYLRLDLKWIHRGQPRTADCRYEPGSRQATLLVREFQGRPGADQRGEEGLHGPRDAGRVRSRRHCGRGLGSRSGPRSDDPPWWERHVFLLLLLRPDDAAGGTAAAVTARERLGIAAASGYDLRASREAPERGGNVGWIISLVVGGIIGWLASIIMKTNAQMGAIANVIVGLIGSSLGFWIAGLIGIGAAGSIGSYIIAVFGAVVLIAILKVFRILK